LNSGRRGDAASDYERALKLQPHDVGILNNFAWVLATAPEDKLRDGHRALALATSACRRTEYKQDYILSTLAAAYAETGDFDSARKWAARAVEAKPSEHAEASRKDELKKELESYKANKPWREALPILEEKKDDGKKVDGKKP
jgi:Tfp pilus assembly protein PilF